MKRMYRVLCMVLAIIYLLSVNLNGIRPAAANAAQDTSANDEASGVQPESTPDAPPESISSWPVGPTLAGTAGILMDARTGTILFGQNADEALYPASITKLMTALLTLENTSLSDIVTFSRNAVYSIEADSSNIAVTDGEQLTVEQCLYALLLQSANEVANGLGEHIAGSMDAFAEMMNNRAAQLGCTNTHFVNAHGLHDENHYTTCHDMALIMKALIHNDTFIKISSAEKYTIEPTNLQPEPRYLRQKHKMLCESEYTYEGTVAGKTGYTPEAGNTLVTYAVRGDMELIAVSMHTNWTHYDDTIAMFDFGFSNFTACNMAEISDAQVNANDFLSSSQGVFDTSAPSLRLDDNSWVILPNNLSPADLESSLTLNTSGSSNVVADITYSYQGVRLGQGSLLLIDNEKKHFDFKEHETAAPTTATKEKPSANGTLFINVWILAAIFLGALILFLLIRFIQKHRSRRRSVIRVRNAKRDFRRRYRKRHRKTRHRDNTMERR